MATNPCLHTGTGPSPVLANGQSYTWHGKIYLLPDNPSDLMERHRRDQLVRGAVEVVPKGSIPDGAKKIDDQRKWD